MAESAGVLNIGTKVDFTGLQKQLKKVKASTSRISKGIDANMKRTFEGLVRHARTAAIGVGVAFGAVTVSAIKAASNAEEVQGKFDVVFRGIANDAENFSKKLAGSVGRSNTEIKDMMAGLQDLFVPFGFTRKAALELDKTLVELAIDVASFNNKVDADVIRDFRAALTGSNETVQKYGVIINDNTLKQEALSQGITKSIKNLTLQEKALLKVSLIQKGSTDAQGDAIRTAGSFANQMKRLRSQILNIKEAIGGEMLPVFTDMAKKMNKFVEDNPKKVKEWAKAFADGVKDMVEKGQELFDKIGGLEGVFKALKITMIAVIGVLTTQFIVGVISSIKSIVGLVTAIGSAIAGWTAETKAIIFNTSALKANQLTRNKIMAEQILGAGGKVAKNVPGTTTKMFMFGAVIGKIGLALKAALVAALKFGAWLITLPVLLATVVVVALAFLTKKTREYSDKINEIFNETSMTQKDISERVAAKGKGVVFDKRVTDVKSSERFAATKQLQHTFARKSVQIRRENSDPEKINKMLIALEEEKEIAKAALHKKFGVGKFESKKIKEIRKKFAEEEKAIRNNIETSDKQKTQQILDVHKRRKMNIDNYRKISGENFTDQTKKQFEVALAASKEAQAKAKEVWEERKKQYMIQQKEIKKLNQLETINLGLKKQEAKLSIGQALMGAARSESSRIFSGVSGGGKVAITGQELFGKNNRSVGKDATYIGAKVDALRKAIEKQEKERDKKESIDTGAGQTVTSVPSL